MSAEVRCLPPCGALARPHLLDECYADDPPPGETWATPRPTPTDPKEDLTHDPHAIPAILAYARSCEVEHPSLAADLVREWLREEGTCSR